MGGPLETAHRAHARQLFALCYRMLGVSADAEEVVQETFVRALEAQPADDAPLGGYLAQVATRLCIDRLRRRQTEGYRGPWLPTPVPDEALRTEAPPSARYDVLESASVAFLLALEALSAEQRAALILGDVFDWSAREVAAALDVQEAHARQLQHRARKALARYDATRVSLTAERIAQTRTALEGFLGAVVTGDANAARRWLADDVVVLNDGGGVVSAAMVPIHGAERAWQFFSRLFAMRGAPTGLAWVQCNGSWGIDASFEVRHPKEPPRGITTVQLDADGRICALFSVLAPDKLPAVAP